jgi:hypothetical protein
MAATVAAANGRLENSILCVEALAISGWLDNEQKGSKQRRICVEGRCDRNKTETKGSEEAESYNVQRGLVEAFNAHNR